MGKERSPMRAGRAGSRAMVRGGLLIGTIGAQELRRVQFFTSSPLRISTDEAAPADSISTWAGA